MTSSNTLIGKANSLAKHRQNCPTRLLPAANELDKLIAEYVVAIVGTTVSTIAGAVATGGLLALAPFTFGITAGVAVATGKATVAIAAGGGVGADKVRKKIKDASDARLTAQTWIVKDMHLCSDMLGGVIAYEERWNEMKEMCKGDHETSSMDAYLEKQLQQPLEVQKRFTKLSDGVVKKWRDQKFDPQNGAAMRDGKAKAKSAVYQFIYHAERKRDFSTVTLFLDCSEITDMLWEYAKEKKKKPRVKDLIEQIVSDLKADAECIQRFAELKSVNYRKP